MSMLQHYYTSCSRGKSGAAGFQTKAESRGITPQLAKTVLSMISYKIPPSIDERSIGLHPIALRYDYLATSQCIVSCIQSNGPDETGRNGNFFAHTVITNSEDFAVYPPIMFWKHVFWKNRDDLGVVDIPPESAFALEPSLGLEEIWPFLNEPGRRDWFRKLLSATTQYWETKRPIVILDEPNNVALWIAAVTFALPPVLRPALTFATYHHDPYGVPYCITGTTKYGDSTFRCSSDEYISRFVLNSLDQRISAVQDSAYADYVCEHYFPEHYDDKLLDFFLTCNSRLPPRPRSAARYLDEITRFVLAVREGTASMSDSASKKAVSSFLTAMESRQDVDRNELSDIRSVASRLRQEMITSGADIVDPDYGRALAMLSRHDSSFAVRIGETMDLLAELVVRNRPRQAEDLSRLVDRLFAADEIERAASSSRLLDYFTSSLPTSGLQLWDLMWRIFGRRLRANPTTSGALFRMVKATLLALETLAAANSPVVPPRAAQSLIQAIIDATPDVERIAFSVLADGSIGLKIAPYWIYYGFVGPRALAERQASRRHLAMGQASALYYEVRRDLLACAADSLGSLLQAWGSHLAADPQLERQIIQQAVEYGLTSLGDTQRSQMVRQVLVRDIVASRLNSDLTSRMLGLLFGSLTLQVLPLSLAELYAKYVSHSGLTQDQSALIRGCLAMTIKRLDQDTIAATNSKLQMTDPRSYEEDSSKWLDRFFERDFTLDEHVKMLQAVYVPRHKNLFWALYWSRLIDLALDQSRAADFVQVLGFWFDQGLMRFANQPYLAQEFFMELPGTLEVIRSQRPYQYSARAIANFASPHPWYSEVRDYLTDTKKKGLLGFLARK